MGAASSHTHTDDGSTLRDLPDEVADEVLSFLSMRSVLAVGATSKSWQATVNCSLTFERLVTARFPADVFGESWAADLPAASPATRGAFFRALFVRHMKRRFCHHVVVNRSRAAVPLGLRVRSAVASASHMLGVTKLHGAPMLRVAVFGLDGAGKTKLMRCASQGALFNFAEPVAPTTTVEIASLDDFGVRVNTMEINGLPGTRNLWKHVASGCNGFIFVVDAADVPRFSEAFDALYQLSTNAGEFLRDAPLLILANKMDLPTAASVLSVKVALQNAMVGRAIRIQGCSSKLGSGFGLAEGLRWLVEEAK